MTPEDTFFIALGIWQAQEYREGRLDSGRWFRLRQYRQLSKDPSYVSACLCCRKFIRALQVDDYITNFVARKLCSLIVAEVGVPETKAPTNSETSGQFPFAPDTASFFVEKRATYMQTTKGATKGAARHHYDK